MKQVNPQQAKDLIAREDIIIVDIRDPASYEEAHIHKAVLVNDHNIETFLHNLDKSKPILCYCYHGHSSQMAAQYFFEQGVKDVYSLIGGFEEWKELYPVEKQ
ncbi:MAG: thiosulfate sulfurtransferase GlpE [Candidatus Omnitrophica bacterium]|nr:thiosulfate sulfurtransferase GlpE [Candidatus Omnitrophota bacterium]